MQKILVMESDPAVLAQVKNLLEKGGFSVLTATHGDQGLALALAQVPEMVICGENISLGKGQDVLAALRSLESLAPVTVILLTTQTQWPQLRSGFHRGADDHARIPIVPQEFLATIRHHLHRQETRALHWDRKLQTLRQHLSNTLPHELRTPLQGIMTASELLSEYFAELQREEIKEIADNIQVSTHRLNHLIQKFLMFNRLEQALVDPQEFHGWYGGYTLSCQGLILAVAQQRAKTHDRLPDLQIQGVDGPLAMPEKWFMTLITEMVDNAFRFSPPHTPVEITSHEPPDRPNHLAITITNRGHGIKPEHLATLGQHIQQCDRQLYEQQGLGLGVAICDRIVQLYGGEMQITSIPQGETTFTVVFPRADPDRLLDGYDF